MKTTEQILADIAEQAVPPALVTNFEGIKIGICYSLLAIYSVYMLNYKHVIIIKKTEVEEFYNHINDIEASIKFTIEHETNNSIPFLDVCDTQKARGGGD